MKTTLLILTLLAFFSTSNNCEILNDGVYQVKYTTSQYSAVSYRLTISGEICNIQINDTMDVKGKVKWLDNCSLKLEFETHTNQDTTKLAKKLYQSFGNPIMEMKATRGDTTFFRTTSTSNLHITINEGYFLRIK
jgi:hypothetical protein